MVVGSSAMRSSVAPNGRSLMGCSGLEEEVGEVGGAEAALCAVCHESRMRPCVNGAELQQIMFSHFQ